VPVCCRCISLSVLINVAMVIIMDTILSQVTATMNDVDSSLRSDPSARAQHALDLLAKIFSEAGWQVRHPASDARAPHADLIARRGPASYAIEVKAGPEDRIDRLVPLWSQACLQASRVAGNHAPLAVVAAPRVAPKAAEQVLKFASEYAPDAAVGIIDFGGLRVFRGPHLEGMDSHESQPFFDRRSMASDSANLFSDLNQWMLKVLLAPSIPDKLLAAPRGRYQHLRGAGVAMAIGILARLVDVEGMVRVLDERHAQARADETRDQFLDERGLAAAGPTCKAEHLHAKSIFAPASASTTANSRRMNGLVKRRLPYSAR